MFEIAFCSVEKVQNDSCNGCPASAGQWTVVLQILLLCCIFDDSLKEIVRLFTFLNVLECFVQKIILSTEIFRNM